MKIIDPIKRTVLLIIFIFYFGSVSNSLIANELDTLSPKNVLILFAFDPAGQVYENITNGLINKIRNDYPHTVNFFIDYAETSRFDSNSHLDDFFEYYSKKYKGFKFDLFISVGPGLYSIVKNRNIPIIDSIPVIYVETYVKSSNINPIIPLKNETVIYLDFEFEKNIDLGLQLFPDTKNIFIVAGNSEYDKRWLNMYNSRMNSLRNKYNITTISGGSYIVVAAPVCAVVSDLPEGAEEVDIDGVKLLKYNDAFFQPVSQSGGDAYEVVSVVK